MSTDLCKRWIWLRLDMLQCYKWQFKKKKNPLNYCDADVLKQKKRHNCTVHFFSLGFYDRPWWQNYTLTQICCLANMSVRNIWTLQRYYWLTSLFILYALGKRFISSLSFVRVAILFSVLLQLGTFFFFTQFGLIMWLVSTLRDRNGKCEWVYVTFSSMFVGHPNRLPLWGSRGPVLTISVREERITQRCKRSAGSTCANQHFIEL